MIIDVDNLIHDSQRFPKPGSRWMVDFMENPYLKWMMTGGTPILGNHQMGHTGEKTVGLD